MQFMRVLFLGLALVGGGTVMAQADDQSRLAMARSVVEVSKATNTMQQMFPSMLAQIRPVLERQGANQQTIGELLALFEKKLNGELGQFADMVAQVYAREFSEEDLASLKTFYQSPAGQHLVAKQVVINQSMTALGTQWGQKIAFEVLQDFMKAKTAGAAKN